MEAQDLGPLRLRVPPQGTDADTLIREIVDTSDRPGELVVVTSDKALYSYVKTAGATVLRAHEWNAMERRLGRPEGSSSGEKPDKENDVEGWLKKFSGGE